MSHPAVETARPPRGSRPPPRITNRVTLGYDRLQSQMYQSRPFDFKFEPGGSMIDLNWVFETFTADYVGNLKLNLGREFNTTFAWGAQSITTEERGVLGLDGVMSELSEAG